jgi:hypothetical protein
MIATPSTSRPIVAAAAPSSKEDPFADLTCPPPLDDSGFEKISDAAEAAGANVKKYANHADADKEACRKGTWNLVNNKALAGWTRSISTNGKESTGLGWSSWQQQLSVPRRNSRGLATARATRRIWQAYRLRGSTMLWRSARSISEYPPYIHCRHHLTPVNIHLISTPLQ